MFRVQDDELAKEKEKVAKASEERDLLLLEKKNLEKKVADLKVAMLPVEDEPEGIASLQTCALAARI